MTSQYIVMEQGNIKHFLPSTHVLSILLTLKKK